MVGIGALASSWTTRGGTVLAEKTVRAQLYPCARRFGGCYAPCEQGPPSDMRYQAWGWPLGMFEVAEPPHDNVAWQPSLGQGQSAAALVAHHCAPWRRIGEAR